MDEKPTQPQQIQRVINVNIPIIYANSFQVGLSVSDIAITLMANGQPFQILNVSYSTAKGLAEISQKAYYRMLVIGCLSEDELRD